MSVINDMGVYGQGGEIMQPRIKNRWRVEFNGIANGGDDLNLTIQAITVDRPKLSFEEIVLDRYNSRAYLAGKHSFEPINITFEDDIGGKVAAVIRDQLEKQQRLIGMNPSAMMGAARAGEDYKFSMNVLTLDGDHTPGSAPLEQFILEGCYISNADWGDLDYSASETVKITLTIRFDHARQNLTGSPGKATGGAGFAV